MRTPHRWHANQTAGRWLLALRERFEGRSASGQRPGSFRLQHCKPDHGASAIKFEARMAILRSLKEGARSVAVLARTNAEVSELRSYLSREGLKPRQVGGELFEEASEEMERLTSAATAREIARSQSRE